jgi:hypothetical protein
MLPTKPFLISLATSLASVTVTGVAVVVEAEVEGEGDVADDVEVVGPPEREATRRAGMLYLLIVQEGSRMFIGTGRSK